MATYDIPAAAFDVGDARFAVVAARFNHEVVDRLLTGAVDYVCAESARGVGTAALALSKPVVFGVLTTDDRAQADARAGGAHGNKGDEAALAALEMVSLARALAAGHPTPAR